MALKVKAVEKMIKFTKDGNDQLYGLWTDSTLSSVNVLTTRQPQGKTYAVVFVSDANGQVLINKR